MTTLIAYANIQQSFPFCEIPPELVPESLLTLQSENPRVWQRYQCRKLAHFLLWQLLKMTGKNTALLGQIKRTESGRPYFPNETIDFNISHSGDWVAVILKNNEEKKSTVGIDIEFPKQRYFLGLMQHFAPEDEVIWFSQQSDAEGAFYRSWCLREAILKSQGVGIVKLSEVRHLPDKLKIFSDYCPQGKLFFTNELPFYLAAFTNQLKNQPHFLQWNGKNLEQKILKHLIHYDVN
ncbi:4'-phosphopantetheinyl transferase family protein [Rodentibacter genomosp. 2]|uniref:4'-phosphopantetheinyl transferase n=1 Tax=Rodentibacter genomosp. 2 TaxID=1908266 RepID=A0A1V3JD15_9PAST|nr:4'-phosphopantetheinyl transferase superfamily protein [Rodentibacter genomosp. 2]OOF54508.1 4'-phosphopantetheinyl transferase [Rodentibacter genomosp. 2]